MKFVLIVILALIVSSDANSISRKCECKAISHKWHVTYRESDISSCLACDCNDAAMINCQKHCRTMVESFASTGCQLVPKGSKVKYRWAASTCSSGTSSEEFTCA